MAAKKKAKAPAKAKPKAAKAKPAAPPAPRPARAAGAAPVGDPSFVRQAPAAERKAALEAVLEKEAVPQARPAPTVLAPIPPTPPVFVKESPAADRKAAVEQLVEESGVKGVLAKAPWKRGAAPAPPPPAPPVAADPNAPRASPRVTMTKAPLSETTGRSKPTAVILDSNALMMQFQFHIDIEKEVKRILGGNYDIVIPTIVVHELERLAKQGSNKEQAEARMAVALAQTFQVVESPGDGDTGILRLAEKLNAVVVTNDRRLRASLRAKDIPSIHMRNQAFLTLEGHIPGQ